MSVGICATPMLDTSVTHIAARPLRTSLVIVLPSVRSPGDQNCNRSSPTELCLLVDPVYCPPRPVGSASGAGKFQQYQPGGLQMRTLLRLCISLLLLTGL